MDSYGNIIVIGFHKEWLAGGLGLSDTQFITINRESTVVLGQQSAEESLLIEIRLKRFNITHSCVGVVVGIGSEADLVNYAGFVHDSFDVLLLLALNFLLGGDDYNSLTLNTQGLF